MARIKKKILFFHFDLGGGGAERVLVNLLNHLSPDKYDITLQTIFGAGPNMKNIPSYVKHKFLFGHEFRGSNTIMKSFSPRLLHSLLIRDHYDIEVAYLENSPTRIISGCTDPNTKKLAWVHVEIESKQSFLSGYRNKSEMLKCYQNVDKICFVAKTAKKSFEHYFPEITTPKQVIYNVNDFNLIRQLSQEPIPFELKHHTINLCSVGRLTRQKRYDRLINIIGRIKSEGYNVKLFLLGEGEERSSLEHQIHELSLDEEVKLLGFDPNPYKYMAKMDLFVCSSRKEGFSTAVTEAVALGIPVLTTDCSGMAEVLNFGKFGKIVLNDEASLFIGLKHVLSGNELEFYRKNIKNEGVFNTSFLVDKYEELFDSL